ncbi:MAG TPA: lysophospholipid acyltransferase family protein [Pyrinomonadaceae bacterium]|nr:lysophospholipid acyltransferase family protein [Pyrinomonadaceae bacterium]
MKAAARVQTRGKLTDEQVIADAFTFADLSSYPPGTRLLIRIADFAFYTIIRLVGSTIRYQVEGWENFKAATQANQKPIYTFWHNRIFASIHFWQKRGIVVMTSRSFDGEYIARFIQRFGSGAARGSSTRGGATALARMERLLRLGYGAAFTIDGPKGPRYVAKMGGVLLAKKTGQPILPFTITPRRYWEAKKSWDQTQAPLPFTRALVDIALPIFVSADADKEELEAKRDELQAALDELDRRGREWRQRHGPKTGL